MTICRRPRPHSACNNKTILWRRIELDSKAAPFCLFFFSRSVCSRGTTFFFFFSGKFQGPAMATTGRFANGQTFYWPRKDQGQRILIRDRRRTPKPKVSRRRHGHRLQEDDRATRPALGEGRNGTIAQGARVTNKRTLRPRPSDVTAQHFFVFPVSRHN